LIAGFPLNIRAAGELLIEEFLIHVLIYQKALGSDGMLGVDGNSKVAFNSCAYLSEGSWFRLLAKIIIIVSKLLIVSLKAFY